MAILLVLLGIATRLMPHPANVTAVGAVALFAGLYLPKRWAYVLPLITMAASDLIIGFYSWPIMAAVYGSFLVSVTLGLWASRQHYRILSAVGATLIGALVFFFVTNAAVWAFGTMYPHTLAGLGTSYLMAIPFFKASLVGDVFFMTILVGLMETVTYLVKKQVPSNIPV